MQKKPAPASENSEEERAFLQKRVALFWKVMFLIVLIGSGLGIAGALKKPGPDLLLTLATTGLLGLFWAVCKSGRRSIRFSRAIEAGGLLLISVSSALLGRLIVPGFVQDHGLLGGQATTMADGFVCMLQLETMAVEIAIRAALIPSRPRRTLLLTSLFGVPTILAATFLVPAADGGFTWRAAEWDAYSWLPPTLAMMWGFAVIACTVISSVIYGLRADVRQARRFGQYVLERKNGEGGMGVVYRATHALLRRPAAIKLLLKDRASEVDLARFEREVQLTARLVHPNTISIFDYGRTAEGVFYYVMEYLDGIDLQRLVDQYGPVEPARAINILTQISGALAEAHACGLVHRDIKPANIVLTERPDEVDVVKVVDFGLVKNFGGNLAESAASDALTGTPLYMSPEAISQPDTVDGRSDLYAVGAVAYFLLTGQHVFDGGSVVEVCSKHLFELPSPPSVRLGKPLPADLEDLVLSCLAKASNQRPASATALRFALLACADAGSIDQQAARAWWENHRSSHAQALRRADGASSPATMAIDLDDRGDEALNPGRLTTSERGSSTRSRP